MLGANDEFEVDGGAVSFLAVGIKDAGEEGNDGEEVAFAKAVGIPLIGVVKVLGGNNDGAAVGCTMPELLKVGTFVVV